MPNFDGAKETALQYFIGTDKRYVFTTYTDLTEAVVSEVTGYGTAFTIKRRVNDADGAALFTATGEVTGAFNANPSVNTQIITVSIDEADMEDVSSGVAHWSLRRTDDGSKAVMAYGTIELRKPVQVA